MENLSKAIYLAGFALLFVFAASTAIYLYGLLDSHMDDSTQNTNIENRVENQYGEYVANYKRTITVGEIYLTALHMDQMHVNRLVVVDRQLTLDQFIEKGEYFDSFLNYIKTLDGNKFAYKFSPSDSTVEYQIIR